MGDCQICGFPSHGAHFGVEACKACAAFFRRSVALNRKYSCRTGRGDCDILKNKHFKCRLCRLNRCVAVGMIVENVQNRQYSRESDGSSPSCSTPSNVPSSSTSTCCMTELGTRQSSPDEDYPHLVHIVDTYKKFFDDMCSQERALRVTHGLSPNLEELHRITFALGNDVMKCNAALLPEFLNSSFSGFADLAQERKLAITKVFIPRFMIWDHIYSTAARTHDGDNKFMFSQSMYVDLNDARHVFCGDRRIKMELDEMEQLLVADIMKARPIVRKLRKMHLSLEEHVALLALLFWTPNLYSEDETTVALAENERARIFRDLKSYYGSMGHDSWECRFGELMALLPSIEWTISVVKEDIVLFKMFDFFDHDSFLCQIFTTFS